jgi:hypothetical protein
VFQARYRSFNVLAYLLLLRVLAVCRQNVQAGQRIFEILQINKILVSLLCSRKPPPLKIGKESQVTQIIKYFHLN